MTRVLPFYNLQNVASIVKFVSSFEKVRKVEIQMPKLGVVEVKVDLPWYMLITASRYIKKIQLAANHLSPLGSKIIFKKY